MARVIDTSGTLNAGQRQALESKLAAFEKAKGSQIVVLMVPTTQPEDIMSYTQRVGDLWKIGRKGVGDGLLLVVAKNDRQVRIATAKTLEGAIPDLAAQQVIDKAITPSFREGDFAGGLNNGVDQLMALISGEKLPEPVASRNRGGAGGSKNSSWLDVLVVLFVAVPFAVRWLSALVGRKAASLATGALAGLVAWWLTASLLFAGLAAVLAVAFALVASLASLAGRSGGSWGAGSGGWGGGHGGGHSGGFRSGGGGDFGGGGASGRW